MAFTFADKADALRAEFDGRHPKGRLSLIAYLADAGVIPTPDTTDDYLTMLDKIVTYVYKDAEGYFQFLGTLDPETEVGAQDELPLESYNTELNTSPKEKGHLYL